MGFKPPSSGEPEIRLVLLILIYYYLLDMIVDIIFLAGV